MRFLVDESCDVALSRALLDAGNDVLEIREEKPGADDEWVVGLAVSENRIRIGRLPGALFAIGNDLARQMPRRFSVDRSPIV
jgi:hypothetical protein